MTSVRRSIKEAKRKLKELKAEDVPQYGSIRIAAWMFVNEWKKAGVPSVSIIRTTARMKAFTRRNERKIKKQGKWAEYREFLAYQKHLQSTLVLPLLIDSPTMSYRKFRELWDKERVKTSKYDRVLSAICLAIR